MGGIAENDHRRLAKAREPERAQAAVPHETRIHDCQIKRLRRDGVARAPRRRLRQRLESLGIEPRRQRLALIRVRRRNDDLLAERHGDGAIEQQPCQPVVFEERGIESEFRNYSVAAGVRTVTQPHCRRLLVK